MRFLAGRLGLIGLDRHPLAQYAIQSAKDRPLPCLALEFHYSQHQGNISVLEPHLGTSGWLSIALFSINSLGQDEDHLIHTLLTDDGEQLPQELAKRLLTLPMSTKGEPQALLEAPPAAVENLRARQQKQIQHDISERNAHFFEQETTKLDHWADDLKIGLESEIKEIDTNIREARKSSSLATKLEDKITAQKLLKKLETQRKDKRRSLFDAQDNIDEQRDQLITSIESKLETSTSLEELFAIRFKII